MLTDQCNLNCPFCWQKKSGINLGTFTPELIDKMYKYFISYFPEYSLSLGILGGEPSLYPELLDCIAKKQLEYYDKCSVRVYTNGITNIDKLLEISHKYENVTYQVSQNYDFILYKDMKKYAEVGSIVIEENTNLEEAFQSVKHIKDLGYRSCYLNFNINDVKI